MPSRLARLLVLALSGLVPASTVSGCDESSEDRTDLGVRALLFIKRAHTVTEAGGVVVNVSRAATARSSTTSATFRAEASTCSTRRGRTGTSTTSRGLPDADFNGADVSFDGQQAVFSMKKDANDNYHIYTVAARTSRTSTFEIHQQTGGDHDDITPIYAPAGRIVFVTNQMYTEMGTRADEYEHSRVVTQLATISVDGGDADRRLFSQNLSHTVAPFMRFDGKIGYSRWEHLGDVNDVKLFAANPDGTQMVAVAGQHGKPAQLARQHPRGRHRT